MLRAIAAAAERVGAQNVDLRGILDWPDPDDPDRTLADAAIDRLLRGVPDQLRRDLIMCTAAWDVERTSRRQVLAGHAWALFEELDRFCSTDLWICDAVLHPFLRRVLLHALAGAPKETPTVSAPCAVHSRLRAYHADHKVVQAMHHTLALGEFAPVVAYLDQRFGAVDTASWLRELYAITAAPRLAKPTAQGPHEQVWELASRAAGGSDDALARLVAAVWISTDPLGDPGRSLNRSIAADFDRLAPRAEREADVLYEEAEKWRTRRQELR